MKKASFFIVLAIMFLFIFTARSEAAVITFDDLTGSGQLTNYAGLTWTDWNYYDGSQPPYNSHSGLERIYDMTNDNAIVFPTPVDFNGAWFAGYSFATVQFEGYLEGVLKGTSSVFAPSGTPTFLAANFGSSIDMVKVISTNPDFFVMDDVTFNASTAAVPEPATMSLVGLGLLGLAGLKRRKA